MKMINLLNVEALESIITVLEKEKDRTEKTQRVMNGLRKKIAMKSA